MCLEGNVRWYVCLYHEDQSSSHKGKVGNLLRSYDPGKAIKADESNTIRARDCVCVCVCV